MSGKVIHISENLHKNLKGFCNKRGLVMSELVEESLGVTMQCYKDEEKKGVVAVSLCPEVDKS